ncbi:uncharacterized protein LOC131846089 [Achroia grisella]|uniref:uncharacterized protein LOC131846089 n=1 Tax=Achroia grisella TaxID=688607 RepID=UPI0027D245C7|nr:uncharacterized protein LOC131846089 [Achroia grisella]
MTREKTKSYHASSAPVKICKMCNGTHTLTNCEEFKTLQPNERSEFVKKNNLCFNCLVPGHSSWNCRLQMFCRVCKRRHHSLLHLPRSPVQPDNTEIHHSHIEGIEEDPEIGNETNVAISSHFTTRRSTALLATALVQVKDITGQETILRALIDQGSQANFISERAAQQLKLKRKSARGTVSGVGDTSTTISQMMEVELCSRYDVKFKLTLNFFIMSKRLTSNLPTKHIDSQVYSHIQNLNLADPNFNHPGRIDMLLGVETYAQIVMQDIIKGPPGSPCAQNTKLGWILFGEVNEFSTSEEVITMHHHIDFDDMLKVLWEIDPDSKNKLTQEEETCERMYKETYSRSNEGRYIVVLPFKDETPKSCNGNTRDVATRRLFHLEKRFEREPYLKTEYMKVMQEYIDLKHMEQVPVEEIENRSTYLPHHAVIKNTSETTKTRVVFDASCRGTNNISLNDELLVGPQLQEDIRYLIMRWRLKKVCYVADIEKMYRQILVSKKNVDYQRLLWRKSTADPIQDYRLLRVTFGTASAPYLAVKTLHQLAEDEGACYPLAAETIKQDFYMDDLMSGQDTVTEAVEVAKNITSILRKGGFNLQKWSSNSAEFLQQFQSSERSTHIKLDMKVHGTIRALGLTWNMGEDKLEYHHNFPSPPPSASVKITKRNILGEIQRLFDPLGWLAPAMIPAKIIIQRLWMEGVSWDDEVNPEIQKDWVNIKQSFVHLKDIEIDRWVHTTKTNMNSVTIHGYCDASTKAYGAVAYLRVLNEDGNIKITIIAAKARVAPVKPVSLPRLELCGAVLLSKLLKQISEATRIPASQIYAWTDSTIVLSWLRGDPSRWQTFVRNRVVTILDNIGNKWFHVQSSDNPADVASRGMLLPELKNFELWWQGPEWLKEIERYNIKLNKSNNFTTELEKRENKVNIHIQTTDEGELEMWTRHFKNFDTVTELLKAITNCRRFLNFKKENIDITTKITKLELEISLQKCIRIIQRQTFEEEILDLNQKKYVKKRSTVKSLNPFIDSNHILRVGGRIRHSNLDNERKHPIILDNKNPLTTLIVADAHIQTLHGGVQLMLNYIRSRYWIIKVKRLVKSYLRKCLICAKQSAFSRPQLMGDLPKERVTPARPFLHSGVDFAGPYDILMSKGRGAKTNKGYIALFICMATKAIHLELVGDLTSEAFIGAFRRFVSRRGKCSDIWSDQGRNFVGANKELIESWKQATLEFETSIAETLLTEGTQWHFIPAYSPNFGGAWESGIKSLKYHLKRILTANRTFEEMTTLLCQIEACLNSRPLCPIDDTDIDNMEVLTPGHFLIGEAPVTVPSPSLKDVSMSNLSRWRLTQKLLNDFWHSWQQEYLSRLQQRPKWLKRVKEFEKGQIVLIKTDHLPPGKWSLGRIVDKHPGPDDITRVYSVKSGNNIVKRSINKLCLLPVETKD